MLFKALNLITDKKIQNFKKNSKKHKIYQNETFKIKDTQKRGLL